MHRNWILTLVFMFLEGRSGFAKFYDLYRADYAKGAFCSAIGGACASDNEMENGFFQNPASLEPNFGAEDYQYDFDFDPSGNTEPGMKVGNTIDEKNFMAGYANSGKKFAEGVAFQGRITTVKATATLVDDQGNNQSLSSTDVGGLLFVNIPMAIRLTQGLSLGFSIHGTYYSESLNITGVTRSPTINIDRFPVIGFSVGFIASPSKSFHLGSWFRSANTYYVKQQIDVQQFSNVIHYSEELGLHTPWIFANGISFNPWEDKRTFLIDLDVVGSTDGGFERTLDTFGSIVNDREFRPKGRYTVLEPHIGWRAPWWKNSNGKYFLGAYYESTRWQGLPGKLHGTVGLSYLLNLPVLGPIDFIASVDGADRYFNLQLSFN